MQKREVLLNVLGSVAQVLLMSAVLFSLYKFLLGVLGVEMLGVWAIVLAATSGSRIAELGLSSSVVKFVAQYLAREDRKSAALLIQTVAISVGITVGVVVVAGYPIAKWLLRLVVPVDGLSAALDVLPLALVSVWIMTMASVFLSGLDGQQKTRIRSTLLVAATLIHFALCLWTAPRWGIMGVAYAQIAQNSFLVLAGLMYLRKGFGDWPVSMLQWSRPLFREVFSYSVNFQISSVAQMLYEPTTKALLAKFGGLSLVAYYEMAARMVVQVRAFITQAVQALVPTIAHVHEKRPAEVHQIYANVFEVLLFLSPPAFALLAAMTPEISEVWIGQLQPQFVFASIVLCLAWFVNTLNVPAYFANLGVGQIRSNTIAHVAIGIANILLGIPAGIMFGGQGVVMAWMVSLATGSHIITLEYHRRNKIPFRKVVSNQSILVSMGSIAAVLLALGAYSALRDSFGFGLTFVFTSLLFGATVFWPMWKHPAPRKLSRWFASHLLNVKPS